MNRITKLFQSRQKNILSIYFTAGYPALNDTIRTIRELDNAGVDMIEIGMPFSDPVADGPVIQHSSELALSNGMSVKLLFEQLENVRKITNLPLILMGYLNPVFKFGMEEFLHKCNQIGIDGLIIPDLPVEEYSESYSDLFNMRNIINIFLITPQTTMERILYLDSLSKGFLYIVSTASTTGITSDFDENHIEYFKKIEALNLKTPGLIGFGISNRETFNQACKYANGAIIGSAFIRALNRENSLAENVQQFIEHIR